ncbi:MAG: hypothetical protein ACTSU5_10500 [Promethearchaeota archaeon]
MPLPKKRTTRANPPANSESQVLGPSAIGSSGRQVPVAPGGQRSRAGYGAGLPLRNQLGETFFLPGVKYKSMMTVPDIREKLDELRNLEAASRGAS